MGKVTQTAGKNEFDMIFPIGVPGTETSNEWLEPVDEAQYSSALK